MNDNAFLDWLAGFVAGEGCFYAGKSSNCRQVETRLEIHLRDDDLDILLEIQERLGMGTIYRLPRKKDSGYPQAAWSVARTTECRRLVDIFDVHPVRAKKRRDYEVWREIVLERSKPLEQRNLEKMYYLADKLRLVRQYELPEELSDYEPGIVQLSLPV